MWSAGICSVYPLNRSVPSLPTVNSLANVGAVKPFHKRSFLHIPGRIWSPTSRECGVGKPGIGSGLGRALRLAYSWLVCFMISPQTGPG